MRRSRASLVIVALSLAALLLSSPLSALAVSRSDANAALSRAADMRRRQTAAEAQADKLVTETKALEAKVAKARAQLADIDQDVDSTQARRKKLEAESATLRLSISRQSSAIASTTLAYQVRRERLGRRIEAVYREGDFFYLQILLESRDFGDLVARTSFVQEVMRADRSTMDDLARTRRKLQTAKTSLERSLQELSAKTAEIAAQENGLRKLQTQRASTLEDQRDAQSAKESLLAETKGNIARLKSAIAAEEAEARRITRLLSGKRSSHGSGKYAGSMAWPAPGHTTVTSPYGWRVHPILHTRKFHSGIDIRAPEGARIVAAGSGKVIYAGDRGGYGNCTMIDHGNGVVTVYAHQDSISVSVGDTVRKGQTIGRAGSTGMSTGPHLHFEVRVNGETRDPMDYL